MDYEKGIPFGAFDSELIRQEISIPEGFTATIEENKIILTRIESEDEKIRKGIIRNLEYLADRAEGFVKNELKERIDWLEKQGESTDINPSEFDLRLNKLLKQFEALPKEELASSLSFYLNVVQNDGTYKADEKKGEQKSAKWSEEDEERIKNILSVLGVQVCWNVATGKKGNPYQKEINWLKSLKDRYTWKPSEEQLEALKNAIHIKPFENPSDSLLWGLYEQIKKLKEKLPK